MKEDGSTETEKKLKMEKEKSMAKSIVGIL
jgi:hypothetical protein